MKKCEPRPGVRSTSQSQEWYDRLSRYYCTTAGRWEAGARAAGLRQLNVMPGEYVLEVGVGPGQDLAGLAAASGKEGRVVGIDLSAGMLSQAYPRRAAAHLAQSDAVYLPFGAETFDAIFMSFTLELFENSVAPLVLGECKHVLRPGGRLGVVAMQQEQPASLVQRIYVWSHARYPRYIDCRPIPVVSWLKSAGFEISSVQPLRLYGLAVACVLGYKLAQVLPQQQG